MPSNPKIHPKRPLKTHPKRGKRAVKAVYAPYQMPEPDGKYGHTTGNIRMICKDLSISAGDFDKAFGVNTVAIDNGKYNYYDCDVRTALFKLTKGKVGKDYGWD